MVAVVASLAATSGAGIIPPPITTAGSVVADPVGAGRANASAIVISLSGAVVGPGVPAPSSCTSVIRKALLLGDHVDDHRAGGGSRSGTVRAPALAGQPIPAMGHRAQRIGAALLERARIAAAHSARHRIQPLIQRGDILAEQRALDPRQPGAVSTGHHVDVAAARTELGAHHGIRVVAIHPVVDGGLGLGHRQRAPPDYLGGQLGVNFGHRRRILDEPGPGHDGIHQAVGNLSGGEYLGHPGQPLAQRGGDHQLMGGHP
jgi:hypothetical protein